MAGGGSGGLQGALIYVSIETGIFYGKEVTCMNKNWTLHVEWENNRISVDIGEIVQLQHCAVKMQRTEDGSKLTGRLSID